MKKKLFFVLVVMLFTLTSVFMVLAASISVTDTSFTDWLNTTPPAPAFFLDSGKDDYGTGNNESRHDITEFGLTFDDTYLYLLFAWDDTDYPNSGNYNAGVKFRGINGNYFMITTYRDRNMPSSDPARMQLYRCTNIDPAQNYLCVSPTLTCTGTSCSSTVQLYSSNSWPDPFKATTVPPSDCRDGIPKVNCADFDTAAEIRIPWSVIGGTPTETNHVFFTYSSVDVGTGANIDGMGANGISCKKKNGQFSCYKAIGPTDVGIVNFTGAAQGVPPLAWGLLGLGVVGVAFFGGKRLLKTRSR